MSVGTASGLCTEWYSHHQDQVCFVIRALHDVVCGCLLIKLDKGCGSFPSVALIFLVIPRQLLEQSHGAACWK